MANSITQYLKDKLNISDDDMSKAEKYASSNDCSLNFALEKLEISSKKDLLNYFAKYYGVRKTVLENMDIHPSVIKLIPKKMAEDYRVIPLDRAGNNIILAMLNPKDLKAIDTIRFQTGYFAQPVFANASDINSALIKYYKHKSVNIDHINKKEGGKPSSSKDRITIKEGKAGEDGPIIKLVNDIILQCINRGASDIHIEPYEEYMRVRLRIDGVLHEIVRPPNSIKAALISRIKIMSEMNIAETRLPQDGAININTGGRDIDFRVNTLPAMYGEKIVLRILDKSSLEVDMTKLGFEPDQLKVFKDDISRPHGMVLVTGPTGSGKTTTLYSALQELNDEETNVMTAEDPVEFGLPGVNQVMMKPQIGLTFASALRAFLRQDPDVIMVGEIRDLETAEIGIKAALTGHMVLSTLHTNSAVDTISRLLNMGIEPFNLVSSLNCIVAQRLMRRICTDCKAIDTSVSPDQLVEVGIPEAYVSKVKIFKGAGCSNCGGSGTKGRVAVHEVMHVNEDIKKAVIQEVSTMDLKKVAMQTGMRTLRQSAINKMVQGISPLSEVLKSTDADSRKKVKKVQHDISPCT